MIKKLRILFILCAFMGLGITNLKAQSIKTPIRTSRIKELLRNRHHLPQLLQKNYKAHVANSSPAISAQVMASGKYTTEYTTMNTGSNPLTANVSKIYKLYSGQLVVFTGSYAYIWDGNTNWRKISGLTGSPISIDEDTTNHKIWIGASDGVYEFDSQLSLIKKYDIKDNTGHSLSINSLTIDGKDSVWVGVSTYSTWNSNTNQFDYHGGGVYLLNGQFTQVLDTLIAGNVTDIKAMSDGTIWITGSKDDTTKNEKLVIYNTSVDKEHTFSKHNGSLPRSGIYGISEDNNGNKWIGLYNIVNRQKGMVGKYNGSSWTFYDQKDGVPYGYMYSLSVLSDGSIYYSSADSTVKFNNGKWALVSNSNKQFPLREVTSVTEDNKGDLLFSANSSYDLTGGGIHVYDGSNWKYISSFNDGGLLSNIIVGSNVDKNGNVWLSSYGVEKFDGSKWTYYNKSNGLASNDNWDILTARDGTIWFSGYGYSNGADSNMVTSYKNGTFTKHDLGNKFHECIFQDHNGNLWFGSETGRGVAKYDGSKVTIYNKSDGLNLNYIQGIGEDAKGNIYVAGGGPVYKFDGSSWTPININGISNYYANYLASDTCGTLYIEVNSSNPSLNGVVVWSDTSYKSYSLDVNGDGNSDFYIYNITPKGNGSVIFSGEAFNEGAYGILYNSKLYNISTHTPSIIFTSAIAKDGSIWSGTLSSGVVRYKTSAPIHIKSIDDYPDDQGGWVTIHVNGFLFDPSQNQYGGQFWGPSWTVWRKNGSAWEAAGTTPSTTDNTNQISVAVPTTMPTGSNSNAYKYVFKVSTDGDVVVESDTMSGYAVDNIAPQKVSGVQVASASNSVTLSWSSVNAPDLENYQVFAWNGSGYDKTKPLATTQSTSVTISDSKINSKQLVVIARDIHNNYGKASDPKMLTAISGNKMNIPKHFALKQNYPNPFNPTTVIRYDVPKRAQVKLEIYNMLGKRVATLVNETKAAGSYRISFDASHMSSGLYFYRFHAGNYTKVKTMTLIK